MKHTYLLVTVMSIAGVCSVALLYAGPLNPPAGPVAPTYKTLGEVEPRVAISATNTPGDGDSVFKITQPGSYYLTGNAAGASGRNGIEVASDNVTIDLNGFALVGVTGALNGVQASGQGGVTIRGGTINGWPQAGVTGGGNGNTVVCEDLIVRGNMGRGLDLVDNSRVARCSVVGNTGLGLRLGSGSLAESCVIQGNGLGGAEVLSGSALVNSTIAFNGGVSVLLNGDGASCRENVIRINAGNTVGIRVAGLDGLIEDNRITGASSASQIGLQLQSSSARNVVKGNMVQRCSDNHELFAGNQLELLISQLPEVLDVPCTATLTGSLTGIAGSNGLTISSDGVTVDLGGHTLTGVAGSLSGVAVSGSRQSIRVKNGTVRSWGQHGLNLDSVTTSFIEGVTATGNGLTGISAGGNAIVDGCNANSNAGDNITAQGNAVITRCNANNSAAGHGINLASGFGIVENCVTRDNNQDGVRMGQRSRVSGCVATGNQQNGIHVFFAGTVTDSFCNANRVCGILCDSGGFVEIIGNQCSENGGAATGAGIRVINNGGNRIENNNLLSNYRGIDVLSTRNFIARNSAAGNSNAEYSIVGGNTAGPIVSGDPATTPNGNHPMVNYVY